MAADDLDFRPPPERREVKRFEPPPWEQEAFGKLQQRKEPQASEDFPAAVVEAQKPEPAAKVPAEKELPAEARMLEMLAGLAEEEPKIRESYAPVQIAAALIMGPLGVMMFVWGVAAMVAAKKTGLVGVYLGLVLLIFGAGFMAAAAWMVYRMLKQRGVL